MKIILTGGESLRLEPSAGMLTIEALSRDQGYSPFHMLGSALAGCTFWVLQSWGSNKNVKFDDLKIEVDWKFAEGEHRVEKMNVRVNWPSLPAELWPRALRAANVCGIHQTLTHSVVVDVEAVGAQSAAIEAPAAFESSSRTAAPDGPSPESNTR